MKLANIITLVRILLIPVFMAVSLSGIPDYEVISLTIFLVASLTDKLDGYVARKYNQISTFGKFIDPLADKLLISAALLILLERGIISSWAVFIILSREFIITALRTVAMSANRVIAAGNSGKLKMVVQVVTISLLLTALRDYSLVIMTAGDAMIWIMVAVTLYSGIEYVWKNRDLFAGTL